MSIKDKEKWDAKYIKKAQLLKPREASINLQNFIKECSGNRALDIACGAGKNTIYLAQNNFHVDAIDVAKIALDTLDTYAKEKGLSNLIDTKLMDLDYFTPKPNIYDLILMANYLDRDVIEKTKNALHVDGIFIVETYMYDKENEKTNSDPINLLAQNELKEIFSDYNILYYDEFKNEDYEIYEMKKQIIVAKKVK